MNDLREQARGNVSYAAQCLVQLWRPEAPDETPDTPAAMRRLVACELVAEGLAHLRNMG